MFLKKILKRSSKKKEEQANAPVAEAGAGSKPGPVQKTNPFKKIIQQTRELLSRLKPKKKDAPAKSPAVEKKVAGGGKTEQKGEKKGEKAIPPKGKLDSHLAQELARIKKEREKKNAGPKKEKIFTIRGFIKAVNLHSVLEKAGMEDSDPKKTYQDLLRLDLGIFILLTIYFIARGLWGGAELGYLSIFILSFWLAFFLLSLALLWLAYLFYLDMKIYQRTKEVEKVFPDFLELASSNISAGMPIDRALWYAVRPNFGVLAKEIETVAKNTLTGEDLSKALKDFSNKYESKTIQRSVSLLLEGLAAGGELAELLNKIALNIEETRILKRDMAANVTTYVIFISFASIVAAPALLGLSTQLLEIIGRITANISTQSPSTSTGMFSFSFSKDAVSVENFRIFAYVMLTISSISAACIVNIIQKGRVKDGLGKIPVFVAISLVIYIISSMMMGQVFSGII